MQRPQQTFAVLLVLATLLALPVAAQIPKEPALAEPIPPVRPLAELLPAGLAQEASKFLAAGKWSEGDFAAQKALKNAGSEQEGQGPSSAAGALTLLALARAGSGDEVGAICRWHAAQNLDPDFRGPT